MRNYYSLSIDQDEHTSTTLDAPPKSFAPLLSPKVNNISLRIDNREPARKLELRLTHGDASIYSNKIEIYGHDEDWVNLTWQKLTDRLATMEYQPSLDTRYHKVAFIILTALAGWLMLSGLLHVMRFFSPPSTTPSTASSSSIASVYFMVACLVFSFGIWPTGWLFSYARRAYPSVELQTGPARERLEPLRRSRLKWFCGIFIVGPSANLLYDIYRSMFHG